MFLQTCYALLTHVHSHVAFVYHLYSAFSISTQRRIKMQMSLILMLLTFFKKFLYNFMKLERKSITDIDLLVSFPNGQVF